MKPAAQIETDWPEWMSPATAARYLDTTESTLADWRLKGKGPAHSKIGQRMVRYRRDDLDTFLEASR